MRLIMFAIMAVLVSSCSPGISKAEQIVKNGLRDPDSAKFTNEREFTTKYGDTVCGEVNVKNGFGGYVGSVRFAVWNTSGLAFVEGSDSESQVQFKAMWKEMGCADH